MWQRLFDALTRFYHSVIPNPNYRIVVAFFFLVIAVLGWLVWQPRYRNQRPNLVLCITILALFLMTMAVAIPHRWQWIVGLLPTLMVGYQLFFLWLYHPSETGNPADETTHLTPQTPQLTAQSYKRAQTTIYNHFNLRTLFTRYGLPAVLLGITGVLLCDIAVDPATFFSVMGASADNPTAQQLIMRGVRLGAVGAYVYVLLELGKRTFRHDITGPIAMWCWVTLVLGPILAGTVAFLWRLQDPVGSTGWWGSGIVLFFTGFAPRRVIAAIERAAMELLKIGGPAVVQTRLIPLTQIRGIGPQVEDRLGEEGIFDVNSLATAEPVRLVRNTSFDMRQILGWMDEAILITTLPRSWEALEEEGITGAIDLAWYYDKVFNPDRSVKAPLPEEIVQLANKAKLTPLSLVNTIQRLSEDTQVQYIWTLYNNFTEFSGGEPKDRNFQSADPGGRTGDPVNGQPVNV